MISSLVLMLLLVSCEHGMALSADAPLFLTVFFESRLFFTGMIAFLIAGPSRALPVATLFLHGQERALKT